MVKLNKTKIEFFFCKKKKGIKIYNHDEKLHQHFQQFN
jgi:hypothetical protein